MTNEEFELLVKKHEKNSEKNPAFYQLKVLLFAGLGYGYVLILLVLLLFFLLIGILSATDGTTVTLGNVKMLIIFGALSFFVIKALIVKMEMPEGYYLKENDAPELEKTIRDLSSKLKTPKIHRIVLDTRYNAAVTQRSKFGLFGPKQNILIIGIPLVSSLNREQFTAVLAHELAHISHADTSYGSFIYRVRMTWGQLMFALEKNEQFGTFLFRRFIKWYYPRFSAYSFVRARQAEYAADAAAARVTSPETVCDYLCSIPVNAQYFKEDYFNELFEVCSKNKEIPKPYTSFIHYAQNMDETLKETYLSYGLQMESGAADTHPCIRDRIKALGLKPLKTKKTQAAIEFFFAKPELILGYFDQQWLEFNGEKWIEQIDSYNTKKQRLAELDNMEELDLHERYERAILTRDLIGVDQGIPLLEGIIADHPAEIVPLAYLTLGDLYLGKEETQEKGLEYVKKSFELEWSLKERALDTLCAFYYYTGRQQALEEARAQLDAWPDALKQFEVETSEINTETPFIPHEKPASELNSLLETISAQSQITEAFLVRQALSSIPERKHYVLCLKVLVPENVDQQEYFNELLKVYAEPLLEDGYVYIINGCEDIEESVKKVENSLIYTVSRQEIA